MKFFIQLFNSGTKPASSKKEKNVDYKQEDLVKLGREQFKRLMEKGLGIPVVLL